jgi:hypothetical protein
MLSKIDKLLYWNGNYVINFEMTLDQAEQVSHSGDCLDDVEALLRVPEIIKQFDAIDPDKIRLEIKETGAWDETELQDTHMNKVRFLWIVGNDLAEQEVSDHD